jgi:hypothetical protein
MCIFIVINNRYIILLVCKKSPSCCFCGFLLLLFVFFFFACARVCGSGIGFFQLRCFCFVDSTPLEFFGPLVRFDYLSCGERRRGQMGAAVGCHHVMYGLVCSGAAL